MASSEPMELITSYHNHYFYILVRVLSQLKPNQTITCQDFDERVKQLLYPNKELANLEYSREVTRELLDIACRYGIFLREGENITKMMHNNVVPPLSMPEKICLKNVLQSSHAKLFFDEPLIRELLVFLSDVPDIPFSKIIDVKGIAPEINANREYIEDFRRILRAVRKSLKTYSTNFAHNGNIYHDDSLPIKIEFDVKERYFCNVAWNLKHNYIYRADMSRISNIQLKHPMRKYRWKVVNRHQEARKETPLVMVVRNTDNAIEQLNRFFTTYPKEVRRFNDDIVWLSVQYPLFDEDKLVNDILSLGTAVQVISPPQVIEKIKQTLKNRLSLK